VRWWTSSFGFDFKSAAGFPGFAVHLAGVSFCDLAGNKPDAAWSVQQKTRRSFPPGLIA
jgi:hypothetical protein